MARLLPLVLLLALPLAIDQAAAAAAHPLALAMSIRGRSLFQNQPPALDCRRTCWARCGNNWKNKMCNKMCNACCSKCNCVPPGTGQDTRHLCPCYDNMINPHTGKLKCP